MSNAKTFDVLNTELQDLDLYKSFLDGIGDFVQAIEAQYESPVVRFETLEDIRIEMEVVRP